MFTILARIWYMIAILPLFVLMEGSERFSDFLKKKNIYSHWDIWHSFLVVLIIFLIVLLASGFKF